MIGIILINCSMCSIILKRQKWGTAYAASVYLFCHYFHRVYESMKIIITDQIYWPSKKQIKRIVVLMIYVSSQDTSLNLDRLF